MLVLITYDVCTIDSTGAARLRKVAKKCEAYGKRVQNSVFECALDNTQCKILKNSLLEIIDKKQDSIRFYFLGNNYTTKIEHYGVKETQLPDAPLVF